MASGDFNQDGIADLALVTAFQYLSVFLGNASGTLEPIFSYDFSTVDQADSPTSVAVGDFNHDGIPDLAVTVARSTIARPFAPATIMVFLRARATARSWRRFRVIRLSSPFGRWLQAISIRTERRIWLLLTAVGPRRRIR